MVRDRKRRPSRPPQYPLRRDGYLLEGFSRLVAADVEGDFQIQLVQEPDQPLLTEAMKTGAHQRRYVALLDAEPFGRFRLGAAALLERVDHLRAKRAPGVKLLRIFEAEVGKHVALPRANAIAVTMAPPPAANPW